MNSPLVSVHQLSIYNIGRMSSAQVAAAFVARQLQFQRLISDISAEQPKSRAQHHLIVGQRGMGKTMLLARIAAELRSDPELSQRFIPLTFAEEQYSVDRLSKFWLNCLDSLADARELANNLEGVREVDATVSRLTSSGANAVRNDQPFADEVFVAFMETTRASGLRPVLLVDNLQLVFDRLSAAQQHSLREVLMRPGSPILIGASPSPPQQTSDYGAPFYDQFKIHFLRPLDEAEMRSLLLHLSELTQRDDVRKRLLENPARLTVLRQLTGGNPRTALTLFFLYAEDFSPSVFGDLESLLDRVTPLYKARFEELTPQQQVVAGAIANHWDPVTAAGVVASTGLPAGTISSQLDRLEKIGFVERTELFGDTRIGYQIAERFFNIWFLMRSSSRRQRREVEFLTRFLESFYEPTDRSRLAQHLMNEDVFSPDRYVWSKAVAASLSDSSTAEELTRHAELSALRGAASEARARLRELIDFDSLQPATLAFDDLRNKLRSLVPGDSPASPEEVARAILGDRAMFLTGERERLAARSSHLSSQEISSILETTKKSRASDEGAYGSEAVSWLSQRLATGQIRATNDAPDWNRACLQAADDWAMQLIVDSIPDGFGANLTEPCLAKIRLALQPLESSGSSAWTAWGSDLHLKLARYLEAESAYREAIRRDPKNAAPWWFLGCLYDEHLQRYSDAESAFREAIALNPTVASHWIGLSRLLEHRFQRYEEAEGALREAIAREPNSCWPWCALGQLMTQHLARHDEAELAYREAIARDPGETSPWNGLGNLYCDHLSRPADAARAFDQALEIRPSEETAQQNRLFLRRDFLGEGSSARNLLQGLKEIPNPAFPDTIHLHEALFAAYDFNWGTARESLAKALTIRGAGFQPANIDDWLRASAVLLHLNYGHELLELLDERGDSARLRPWYEALRAHLAGDRRALQNVAPEIRSSAEDLYDGIEIRRLKLPDVTRRGAAPKAKPGRSRSGRSGR